MSSSRHTRTSSYAPTISSGVSSATRSSFRTGHGSSVSSRSSVTSSSTFSTSSVSSSRSDRTIVPLPPPPPPSFASSVSTSSRASRNSTRDPSAGTLAVIPRPMSLSSYASSHMSDDTTPVIPPRPGTILSTSSRRRGTASHMSDDTTPVIPPRPGTILSTSSRQRGTASSASSFTSVDSYRPSSVRTASSRYTRYAFDDLTPVIPPRPPTPPFFVGYPGNPYIPIGPPYSFMPPPSFVPPPSVFNGSTSEPSSPFIPPRPSTLSPPPTYRSYDDDHYVAPVHYPISYPCPPPLSYPGSPSPPVRCASPWSPTASEFGRLYDSYNTRTVYRSSDGWTEGGSRSEHRHSRRHRRRHSSSPSRALSTLDSVSTISSSADRTVPVIHKLFTLRPDPRLIWDLKYSCFPISPRRDISDREWSSPAFSPPLSRIWIILDPHAGWKFELSAPTDECFTVATLAWSIMKLMKRRGRVPHVFWARASCTQKEAAVEAMLRRKGRRLRYRSPDVSRLQALEEEVLDGARNGSTNLLVKDLLGEETYFTGLELYKAPDEWLLHTYER